MGSLYGLLVRGASHHGDVFDYEFTLRVILFKLKVASAGFWDGGVIEARGCAIFIGDRESAAGLRDSRERFLMDDFFGLFLVCFDDLLYLDRCLVIDILLSSLLVLGSWLRIDK